MFSYPDSKYIIVPVQCSPQDQRHCVHHKTYYGNIVVNDDNISNEHKAYAETAVIMKYPVDIEIQQPRFILML